MRAGKRVVEKDLSLVESSADEKDNWKAGARAGSKAASRVASKAV